MKEEPFKGMLKSRFLEIIYKITLINEKHTRFLVRDTFSNARKSRNYSFLSVLYIFWSEKSSR